MGLFCVSCLRWNAVNLRLKNIFEKWKKGIDISEKAVIIRHVLAGVAHPVERHLAKVEVASSSLVTRSIKPQTFVWGFFFYIVRPEQCFLLRAMILFSVLMILNVLDHGGLFIVGKCVVG